MLYEQRICTFRLISIARLNTYIARVLHYSEQAVIRGLLVERLVGNTRRVEVVVGGGVDQWMEANRNANGVFSLYNRD